MTTAAPTVSVATNRHGKLLLRVRFSREKVIEVTTTRKEKDGRLPVEALAKLIQHDLLNDVPIHEAFTTHFGACPRSLLPPGELPAHAPHPARAAVKAIPKTQPLLTLGGFAEWWIKYIDGRERKSYRRHAASYLRNVVVPILGKDLPLAAITTAVVKQLQDEVLVRTVTRGGVERPIRVKTAKNIITCFFRTMLVEAMERKGVPAVDPFPMNLRWPKPAKRLAAVGGKSIDDTRPDPFERHERDAICKWYREHDLAWFPWVYLLFHEGLRPSEASALLLSDVDLKKGWIDVTKSLDEGEVGEPKTKGSNRIVHLAPATVAVLREIPKRLPIRPDSYFFVGSGGKPVYTRDWARDHGFFTVLAKLDIRQRKFYATRHTSISCQLSDGRDIFRVAKHHGTSVAMIENNYGKWLAPDDRELTLRSRERGEK